jgi:hypothetical protein
MNFADDCLKSLSDLGVQIQQAEERHRQEFASQESTAYNTARIMIDGLISSIFLKTDEAIIGITPEGEYQLLIGVSFIRTHLFLNNVILDGHIVDSHCLLRKQLEQLARLQELESQTVGELKKKTPNIKNAGAVFGRIYGAQSEVAHFSHPEVGYSLLTTLSCSGHSRVTALPSFSLNSVYAMNSRLFHGIQFAAWFIERLTRWYPKRNHEALQKQFCAAFESAVEAKIITTNESKDG